MKKTIRLFYILMLSGTVAAGLFILDLLIYAGKPGYSVPVTTRVTIAPGQGLVSVASLLEKNGLITHPLKFRLIAQIKGCDRQIKTGEYDLSPVMSPARILDILVKGAVHHYKITIPEGYNLRQIASVIADAGLAQESDFLSAATSPDVARRFHIHGNTLEGYLFPDTYYFPRGVPVVDMIGKMVERFDSVFIPEWEKQADALGFSIHDIITIASIIEKETGDPSERPIISSVFHNRLKKGMRLESDPTVIYGIQLFDGNLTRKHLSTWTPYNTYKIKGLPPGPIANPGIKSIEAALYPADTPYLYFVSKKDHTHQFSTDISDHNRAVRKYQSGR